MIDWFLNAHPIVQAFLATMLTYLAAAAGAAVVFFTRNPSKRFMDGTLGMASGVMIAASFWSLLDPAVALSEGGSLPVWLPPLIGFLAGGVFLWGIDLILPHLHPGQGQPEGVVTSWKRATLLVLALLLHNIPEGLAVGVAFGAAAYDLETATIGGAIAVAIGLSLHNFPEGIAVALPIRREGFSRTKAFVWGQAAGMVEPIAGVIGAAAVLLAQPILPYALSFAAGAMIYVVAEELIPEAQRHEHGSDVATIGVMLGFALMMTLAVALE